MLPRRFLSLSIQTACALTACAGLVAFCYWQIDRPVAWWVRDHVGAAVNWLRWPDIITAIMIAAPIWLVWAGITRLRRPWQRHETLLVAIAMSVVGMILLKQILKFIFGRPGTRLWLETGGSLADRDFAFRWFHGFHPYDSFPSGHMTIACTLASLAWFLWPKWRGLAVAAVAIVACCLLITNYHFVGDIIAGGCLGWLGGAWSVQLMPRSILPTETHLRCPPGDTVE
jgi:membrane-associated phospholipid phosphatase